MSHILKIILRVILKRCYNTIDWEIDEFQSGFRKGMGTREGIFNMKIIAEKYIDVNKDIYVCLIDYQKAFDRVNHEKLIECLRGIGIRGNDLRFVRNLYWQQRAYMQLQSRLSSEINIKKE